MLIFYELNRLFALIRIGIDKKDLIVFGLCFTDELFVYAVFVEKRFHLLAFFCFICICGQGETDTQDSCNVFVLYSFNNFFLHVIDDFVSISREMPIGDSFHVVG